MMEKMSIIMNQLQRDPYYVLDSAFETQPWYKVRRFDHKVFPHHASIMPVAAHGGNSPQYLPEYWHATTQSMSYNVHENRLLKHFLVQLAAKVEIIQQRAQHEVLYRQKQQQVIWQHNWHDIEAEEIEKLQAAIAMCRQFKQRCVQWVIYPS